MTADHRKESDFKFDSSCDCLIVFVAEFGCLKGETVHEETLMSGEWSEQRKS